MLRCSYRRLTRRNAARGPEVLKQAASEPVLVRASAEGENKELCAVRLLGIPFIGKFRYATRCRREAQEL